PFCRTSRKLLPARSAAPWQKWPPRPRAMRVRFSPSMNLAHLLLQSARRLPERPALAAGRQAVRSYRDLAARVCGISFSLKSRFKLAQGERVALAMKNCPQYYEVLFGCWHAGLAAVPMNAKLHAAPLSHGSGLYGLPHFAAGAVNVIPESGHFEPQEIFDLLDHWQNTSFFAAPTMIVRLLSSAGARTPRHLKTLIYGGAPMYVADSLRAIDLFGPRLYQLYGQGEAPM